MTVHRVLFPTVVALTLAGCMGHIEPQGSMGLPVAITDHSKTGWDTTVADGPVVEPAAPAVTVSETVSWGEPTITPVSMPAAPHAVADSDGPYLLDTADRLRIFVYGQPNLSRLYTVDHDGNIVVPLIGKVRARGKTVYRLAAAIKSRLGSQFVRDPQVTVDINQNRPFFIMGEVRNAGQFPFVSGMTVQKAIAIGGGYSERAKRGYARITRRINGVVEVLDVPSDYVVKPGDLIEVDERFF